MKKRNISIILFLLFLILIGGGLVWKYEKGITDSNEEKNLEAQTKIEEESWEEKIADDIYKTEIISTDFAVTYDSYEDVVEEAELTVVGEVKGVRSFIENDRAISYYDLIVKETNNEIVKQNDVITVYSIGGKIKYSEYVKYYKEDLLGSMTEDELEKEISEHGDEYIEDIYEGIPNLQTGDTVALCLGTSDEIGDADYYIVGTSYFGQFMWDESNNSAYKLKVEMVGDNKRKYTQREKVSLKQFRQKTKVMK